MTGWKTWLGVASGILAAIAAALGVDLTPEQLDAIQLLVVSVIGLGLGHKADKATKAAEAARVQGVAVAVQTLDVAQRVARVDEKVDPAALRNLPRASGQARVATQPWPNNV